MSTLTDFEESLQDFQCAFSNDKHFIIEPIVLSNCGHTVCKSCLSKGTITAIKCNVCGEISQHINNTKESTSLRNALKFFLGNMFTILEKQTTIQLDKLKSNFHIKS
jgi:hypothetical protein